MVSNTIKEAGSGCTTATEASRDFKRRKLDPPEVIVEVEPRFTSKAAENDPVSRERRTCESIWTPLASMELNGLNEHFSPPLEDEFAARGSTGTLPSIESDKDEHDELEYDFENNKFAEFEWLEQIDGIAKSAGKEVAYCNAKLIRRSKIACDFYAALEQPSQETSSLALACSTGTDT
ncbi:uncharacterized protein EKO05_0010301 [Ascochyta rabiei]|uniref:Uncharacterized protein n=1 Tax=Didymella rabiei TaxID=5454 RepID=A0A163F246_DIDRA|nr:uncharacterized protein EKO05_0010301 [Ascochyta rabiei]KZM24092.1 hypothetical protein ST47_g4788 [Ascochyta rabiei]UPX20055.1 hypothetical protein EKO05_0010301 [Ascochyta rabiei]